MLHRRTILSSATLVFLVMALPGGQDTRGEDEPQKLMQVELILSDSEVFTSDGLAYKVVITNISRSSITICAPFTTPPYSCVIEGKSPDGEWREIWDYKSIKKRIERGLIEIPAGSAWAEYGKVFLTEKTEKIAPVFDKEGKWELRGRVKCVIGNYASDPVPLEVKAWPEGKEALDKRARQFAQLVLDSPMIPKHLDSGHWDSLRKSWPAGGAGKTFELFRAATAYRESGEVGGKKATAAEALAALSPSLDAVRRDQLAFLLGFHAVMNEEWKDVAALVPELKEECNLLISLRGELEGAITLGKFPRP